MIATIDRTIFFLSFAGYGYRFQYVLWNRYLFRLPPGPFAWGPPPPFPLSDLKWHSLQLLSVCFAICGVPKDVWITKPDAITTAKKARTIFLIKYPPFERNIYVHHPSKRYPPFCRLPLLPGPSEKLVVGMMPCQCTFRRPQNAISITGR